MSASSQVDAVVLDAENRQGEGHESRGVYFYPRALTPALQEQASEQISEAEEHEDDHGDDRGHKAHHLQ